jgi:hypothetical protein
MTATTEAREVARKVNIALADARAAALAPVIAEIQASGMTTAYTIAAAFTKRGIPTARGHRFWGSSQVHDVLKRLDRLAIGDGWKSHPTPDGAADPAPRAGQNFEA